MGERVDIPYIDPMGIAGGCLTIKKTSCEDFFISSVKQKGPCWVYTMWWILTLHSRKLTNGWKLKMMGLGRGTSFQQTMQIFGLQ